MMQPRQQRDERVCHQIQFRQGNRCLRQLTGQHSLVDQVMDHLPYPLRRSLVQHPHGGARVIVKSALKNPSSRNSAKLSRR